MSICNVDIVCGLAWGDEAKGKIVSELLTKNKYNWVARWCGGSNAGHTIYVNSKKYITHIVPAGIFHNISCYIGPDCFINLKDFDTEMEYLKNNGFDTSLVYVSRRAHVITEDNVSEDREKYKEQQGSTGKGIAPTARNKFGRTGITLKSYIQQNPDDPIVTKYHNNFYDMQDISPLYGNVLCEGAQGFWLDINFGNYPYVTSANTLPYSACSLGFSPKLIRNIWGAAKIYDTRVGVDPEFMTVYSPPQADSQILLNIADVGEEFGSTTNRKRGVNWLNLDKLIEAINVSGVNNLVISKTDILSNKDINTYKFYFSDKLNQYNSLEEMMQTLKELILFLCPHIEKIIFSNRPDGI